MGGAKGGIKSWLLKGMFKVRGSSGEHSEAVGGKYDISNRERLGLTEYEVQFLSIMYSVHRYNERYLSVQIRI